MRATQLDFFFKFLLVDIIYGNYTILQLFKQNSTLTHSIYILALSRFKKIKQWSKNHIFILYDIIVFASLYFINLNDSRMPIDELGYRLCTPLYGVFI